MDGVVPTVKGAFFTRGVCIMLYEKEKNLKMSQLIEKAFINDSVITLTQAKNLLNDFREITQARRIGMNIDHIDIDFLDTRFQIKGR